MYTLLRSAKFTFSCCKNKRNYCQHQCDHDDQNKTVTCTLTSKDGSCDICNLRCQESTDVGSCQNNSSSHSGFLGCCRVYTGLKDALWCYKADGHSGQQTADKQAYHVRIDNDDEESECQEYISNRDGADIQFFRKKTEGDSHQSTTKKEHGCGPSGQDRVSDTEFCDVHGKICRTYIKQQ